MRKLNSWEGVRTVQLVSYTFKWNKNMSVQETRRCFLRNKLTPCLKFYMKFTWINRGLRWLQLITNDQNSLIQASYMWIFPRNLNIFGLLMKNKTFKDVILDVWEEINIFWYIIFWPNDKWVKKSLFSGPAAVKLSPKQTNVTVMKSISTNPIWSGSRSLIALIE